MIFDIVNLCLISAATQRRANFQDSRVGARRADSSRAAFRPTSGVEGAIPAREERFPAGVGRQSVGPRERSFQGQFLVCFQ